MLSSSPTPIPSNYQNPKAKKKEYKFPPWNFIPSQNIEERHPPTMISKEKETGKRQRKCENTNTKVFLYDKTQSQLPRSRFQPQNLTPVTVRRDPSSKTLYPYQHQHPWTYPYQRSTTNQPITHPNPSIHPNLSTTVLVLYIIHSPHPLHLTPTPSSSLRNLPSKASSNSHGTQNPGLRRAKINKPTKSSVSTSFQPIRPESRTSRWRMK